MAPMLFPFPNLPIGGTLPALVTRAVNESRPATHPKGLGTGKLGGWD